MQGSWNVLNGLLAAVHKGQRKFLADLILNGMRNTKAAWLAQSFQSGSNIDTVAKYILSIKNHVADIDTNAQQEPLVVGRLEVALDHSFLNSDCTGNGLNRASKNDQKSVARGLDDDSTVSSDSRINKNLTMCFEGLKS